MAWAKVSSDDDMPSLPAAAHVSWTLDVASASEEEVAPPQKKRKLKLTNGVHADLDQASEDSLDAPLHGTSAPVPDESPHVQLLSTNLQLLGQVGGQAVQFNSYARNGMKRSRIRSVLKDGACKCNLKCATQFSEAQMMVLCSSFWALPKDDQDMLMYALSANSGMTNLRADATKANSSAENSETESSDSDDEEHRGIKRKYELEGKNVCSKAFIKLLGISAHRKARIRRCPQYRRRKEYKHVDGLAKTREAPKQDWCHSTLAMIYCQLCEDSPRRFLQNTDDAASEPSDDEMVIRDAASFQMVANPAEVLMRFSSAAGLKGLPKKDLPPGQFADLYLLARAHAKQEGVEAPSYEWFRT